MRTELRRERTVVLLRVLEHGLHSSTIMRWLEC